MDANNIPPIRFVVVGDDKNFGKFIAEYVSLLPLDDSQFDDENFKNPNLNCSNPLLIDRNKLDMRIYVIPHGVNFFAHWLAQHDDLYNMNIYSYLYKNVLMNVSQNMYGLTLSESLKLIYEQAEKEKTKDRGIADILQ